MSLKKCALCARSEKSQEFGSLKSMVLGHGFVKNVGDIMIIVNKEWARNVLRQKVRQMSEFGGHKWSLHFNTSWPECDTKDELLSIVDKINDFKITVAHGERYGYFSTTVYKEFDLYLEIEYNNHNEKVLLETYKGNALDIIEYLQDKIDISHQNLEV